MEQKTEVRFDFLIPSDWDENSFINEVIGAIVDMMGDSVEEVEYQAVSGRGN